MIQKRLGRGLEFLLGGSAAEPAPNAFPTSGAPRDVDVDRVLPNPDQPRQVFESEGLDELKKSIEKHGLLQPIIVRQEGEQFFLIAGERRWRACRELGLKTVPAIVRSPVGNQSLELALIENIQRQNLNPIEEARAYQQLVERGLSVEQIAEAIAKSRPFVANRIRLLELDEPMRDAVSRGTISAGHARALLGIKDADERRQAFLALLEGGGTVREIERKGTARVQRPPLRKKLDPNVARLERDLTEALSARTRIRSRGQRGVIQIRFESLDEFDRLLQRLKGEPSGSR
ncbi:MAG: ParB/RepB/Spo0J family partition protein [Planctomycetota bacterium]